MNTYLHYRNYSTVPGKRVSQGTIFWQFTRLTFVDRSLLYSDIGTLELVLLI